jgi:hypothetical protein
MLELDDVGAEVAEEHACERRREERGRLDHADPLERSQEATAARRVSRTTWGLRISASSNLRTAP